MKAQGLGARGGTETEEPGRRWSGSRQGGRYWASPQKTVSVTLVAPVQPLHRPLAQIQESMPWTVLLGCSPFPKGVWTQLWGGGWRRPALALAGQRLQEPGPGAALEDSGTGPLPPAPRHPSGGPAQPGPRPSSGPKSGLRAPSLPHPGMLQGEVRGAGGQGLLLSEPCCGLLTHRPQGPGSRAKGTGSKQSEEGTEAAGCKTAERNQGSPQPLLAPSPSPSPGPLPARESFGRAGLTQSAGEQALWGPPRSPAAAQRAASRGCPWGGKQVWLWQESQNRKARMRRWTQVSRGPGQHEGSWEGSPEQLLLLPT